MKGRCWSRPCQQQGRELNRRDRWAVPCLWIAAPTPGIRCQGGTRLDTAVLDNHHFMGSRRWSCTLSSIWGDCKVFGLSFPDNLTMPCRRALWSHFNLTNYRTAPILLPIHPPCGIGQMRPLTKQLGKWIILVYFTVLPRLSVEPAGSQSQDERQDVSQGPAAAPTVHCEPLSL